MSGCLALVAVFGVALWFGHDRVAALGLPLAWPVAAVLALTTTLAVGSLQGLWLAWQGRAAAGDEPAVLADGATVRLSGVLQPEGAPLVAPYSGRAAVYLWHEATSRHDTPRDARRVRPRFNGVAAAASRLHTRTRQVVLRGMPAMRPIPEQAFDGASGHAAAARLLAGTAWTRAPDIASLDLQDAAQAFAQAAPDMPLINAQALDRLQMTIGRTTEAELLQRLPEHPWLFRERIVPPGATVTVTGTWRAAQQVLEIGLGPATPEHGLLLGGGVEVAGRQWRHTLAFAIGLVVLAVAAHGVVLGAGGAWVRKGLETLAGG
ncbi:MAG: hypothetical protein KF683_24800 [Rubrivivax sp.]|nr:hypothetical protein [Rubrivivax sp.]